VRAASDVGRCASRGSTAARIVGGRTWLRHQTPRSTTPSMSQAAGQDKCGCKRGDKFCKKFIFARGAPCAPGIARGLLLSPVRPALNVAPSCPRLSAIAAQHDMLSPCRTIVVHSFLADVGFSPSICWSGAKRCLSIASIHCASQWPGRGEKSNRDRRFGCTAGPYPRDLDAAAGRCGFLDPLAVDQNKLCKVAAEAGTPQRCPQGARRARYLAAAVLGAFDPQRCRFRPTCRVLLHQPRQARFCHARVRLAAFDVSSRCRAGNFPARLGGRSRN
jgi:hypothetical protein